VLEAYGLTPEESRPVAEALCRRPEVWVDFMMRFELGLEEPKRQRAVSSALTIAAAFVIARAISR
jgi:hypothetical protein